MIIMIYVMISFVFWRYGAGARVEDDGLNNYQNRGMMLTNQLRKA